jgi:hypothetical protein
VTLVAKTLERDPKDAAHWSTTYVWTQPAEDIIERLTGYLK